MTSSSFSAGEPYTASEIEAMFTELPPVHTAEMIGLWRARPVRVHNKPTSPLVSTGWYGMRFTDDNHVDTLLYRAGDGELFAADPAGIAEAIAEGASDVAAVRSRVEVTDPVACMRMVEYRGTVSTAIIYYRQPVIDYLRRIDEHTILGVAEVIGQGITGVFLLSQAN